MLLMLIIGCHVFDDGLIENTCEDTPLGCAGVDNSDDSGGPVDPAGDTGAGLVDADGDGLTADEDCDDADPNVGAEETRYVDGDGDGYGAEEAQACPGASGYADVDGDCDDDAPEANPGEVEVCGDGLDNDCDNTANDCGLEGQYYASEFDLSFSGSETEARMGYTVAIIGDTNGDGVNEFALGSPFQTNDSGSYTGGAALISGDASSGAIDDVALAIIDGASSYDYLAWNIQGPGDLNGDGLDDLLLSAPYSNLAVSYGGAIYGYFGPLSGALDTNQANTSIYGETSSAFTGAALGSGVDVDGDGGMDLVISAPYTSTGLVYVLNNELVDGERYSVESASARFYGESVENGGVLSLSMGDLSGDGIGDFVGGAPYAGDLESYGGGGVTYVELGPLTADRELQDADVRMEGSAYGDSFGSKVLADTDFDGDGHVDLVSSAPYFSPNVELNYSGAVYVFYGPLNADLSLSDADVRITGALSYSYTGISLDAGSLDGTDRPSLLLGATGYDPAGSYNGTVYAVEVSSGSIDTSEAYFVGIGDVSGDAFGNAIAVGEIDGDGAEDLLVGAPYATSNRMSYNGGGWVMFGRGW